MRCYFWGTNNRPGREDHGPGVISFAIPDWGVQFRAAKKGNATECEYAALLAFLRFVDMNKKVFEGVRLEIFTDAAAVVYQVNRRAAVPPAQAKLWAMARRIRLQCPFELCWVPREQNRAIDGVLHLAPLQMKSNLRYPTIESPHTPHDRLRNDPSIGS